MASFLRRAIRGAAKLAKSPLGQAAMLGVGFIPGAGVVTKGLGVAGKLMRSFPVQAAGAAALGGIIGSRFADSGGAPAGLPALPGGGGFPMLPGGGGMMEAAAMQQAVSGRKGTASMPPLTMEMIQQLEAAGLMIGYKDLRPAFRSPRKGFVVVHPGGTATFALRKDVAKAWGLWKPSSKPPISAGDWNAIRKANQVVKKLARMNRDARKVANFGSRRATRPMNVIELPGRKVVGRKAA